MNTKTARQEALQKVAQTFVVTSECKNAQASFDLLMSLGQYASGLCLLICGESGVGKSTLVKWLIRKLPSSRNQQGGFRLAVYVEIPTSPTAIAVFEAILTALGDPRPSQGTRPAKKRRVIYMMGELGVKLLVLDDLQHIVDRKSDRILFDASEAIKELLIEYPMSVLCAGLTESARVVDSNEQLSRRHMATLRLERFNWNSNSSRRRFMAVLKGFHCSLAIYDMPDLQHEEVALRFFLATGGIMDFVFKLFLFASEIAATRGLNSIGLEVFHEAWTRAFLHSSCSDKPLSKDFNASVDTEGKIDRALKINLRPRAAALRASNARTRLRSVGL